MAALSIGVDVGGTFTDAVLAGGGAWHTAKVPTTPGDESRGVMEAIAEVLHRAGASESEVEHFGHGTTVATNALLEERGARTALVTTEGFADVIEIARQARPELYRPCRAGAAPLVPRELRLEVRERMAPDGPVTGLEDSALDDLAGRLGEAAPESVAVSLLHSYAHPEHERRVAAAVREALPDAHVSVSHEVAAVFREYERTSTTVIDAYLSPLLARYLGRLGVAAADAGLPEPEIMRSSGGLMSAAAAARNAAWTVLSGPAAGTVGAAHAGSRSGSEHVISFDMGGTSCDVAVIESGQPLQAGGQEVSGRVILLPMVDVHTVGAGGGSIGWADRGGALRVGPRSAGARPGPACYGHGGNEPTVTDANLLLGYLGAGSALAGGVALDAEAAERALATLGRSLGMSAEDTAWGMARVADEEMVRALRVVTVERGIDPRGHAMVAFGGAGPMHALRIADQLGIARVLSPRGAGVLSAHGLVVAERRRDVERTVLLSEEQLAAGEAARQVAALAAEALAELPGARLAATYDLRYRGQAHELSVPGALDARGDQLRDRFAREHRARYGYAEPEGEVELVNIRVTALAPRGFDAEPGAAVTGESLRQTSRRARFGSDWCEATVLCGALAAGQEVQGPAVCELAGETIVVPPGWRGAVDRAGTLVLERT
jgi:N-methylhydantoinase A